MVDSYLEAHLEGKTTEPIWEIAKGFYWLSTEQQKYHAGRKNWRVQKNINSYLIQFLFLQTVSFLVVYDAEDFFRPCFNLV